MKIFQIQEGKYVEIKNCGVLQRLTKKRSLVAQVLSAASELPKDTCAILRFSRTERLQIISFGHQLMGDMTFDQGPGRKRTADFVDLLEEKFLGPEGFATTYVPADEADNPIVVSLEENAPAVDYAMNVLAVGRNPLSQ